MKTGGIAFGVTVALEALGVPFAMIGVAWVLHPAAFFLPLVLLAGGVLFWCKWPYLGFLPLAPLAFAGLLTAYTYAQVLSEQASWSDCEPARQITSEPRPCLVQVEA
jgi:hypothetical protein